MLALTWKVLGFFSSFQKGARDLQLSMQGCHLTCPHTIPALRYRLFTFWPLFRPFLLAGKHTFNASSPCWIPPILKDQARASWHPLCAPTLTHSAPSLLHVHLPLSMHCCPLQLCGCFVLPFFPTRLPALGTSPETMPSWGFTQGQAHACSQPVTLLSDNKTVTKHDRAPNEGSVVYSLSI